MVGQLWGKGSLVFEKGVLWKVVQTEVDCGEICWGHSGKCYGLGRGVLGPLDHSVVVIKFSVLSIVERLGM